jgi:hypothetical protein
MMHMNSTTKGNLWLDMLWFGAIAIVLIVAAAEYFSR